MKILKELSSNLWRRGKNSIPLFLVAGFFVFLGWIFLFYPNSRQQTIFKPAAQKAQIIDQKASTFNNVKLEAKAAYVFDVLENRPLFETNTEFQLPLASIAKIMTAIVAEENLPSYLLVTISPEAILQEGVEGFLVEEQWQINELIDAMLVSSSNDAAFTLASEYNKNFPGDFVSLMNQKAKELGLTQTYFLNPTGLDLSKNTSGAHGSAKDVAKLLLYALKNHSSLLEATRFMSINLHSRNFKNTNQIVNNLPGFIAGKTGFSDLAGGNLAIIADKGYGHPIVIVVLGSTFEGRFNDVKTLYQTAVIGNIN